MKYAYSLYKNSIRCTAQVVLRIFANKTAAFANNHPNFKCKFSYAKIRTSTYSECCAFITVSMSKLRNPSCSSQHESERCPANTWFLSHLLTPTPIRASELSPAIHYRPQPLSPLPHCVNSQTPHIQHVARLLYMEF